jgi:hypothetical protein
MNHVVNLADIERAHVIPPAHSVTGTNVRMISVTIQQSTNQTYR